MVEFAALAPVVSNVASGANALRKEANTLVITRKKQLTITRMINDDGRSGKA